MEGKNLFDIFLEHCTGFQLAPPWEVVPPDPHAFLAPSDPAAAVAALLARYTAESVIEAGLAQRNAAGHPEIHPFLATPHAPLVALCDTSTGRVTNLLRDAGCVRGFRFTVFSVLVDQFSFRAIDGFFQELFLTGDIEDTVVLRSLGFAAAPVGNTPDGGRY
jgi:hypothetical protein